MIAKNVKTRRDYLKQHSSAQGNEVIHPLFKTSVLSW